jgi:hypothetical protein
MESVVAGVPGISRDGFGLQADQGVQQFEG